MVVSDIVRMSEDYPAPLPVYRMMTLLNGTRDTEQLRAAFDERFQQIFPEDLLEQLLQFLDQRLLLDNQRSRDALSELKRCFLGASVRASAHAGSSYCADPEGLLAELDGFFAGLPECGDVDLRGILAPHIDLRCGGQTSAYAFKALSAAPAFDRVVILGIGHYATTDNPYIVSRKAFETPLGQLQVDQPFVDLLHGRCGDSIFRDEFAHRSEHSIEFQVVFLQYIARQWQRLPMIVPILCGALHRHVHDRTSPSSDAGVVSFIDALSDAARELPGRTAFVAGVDFSHIGRKFGHERDADGTFRAEAEAHDRGLISRIEAGDVEGFWECVVADGNYHNICGYPAIYTLLKSLGGGRGSLLRYDATVEQQTASAVSYAAVSYSPPG